MIAQRAATPYLRLGIVAAAAVCAADQASKLYLLFVYDLPNRAPLRLCEVISADDTNLCRPRVKKP